MTDENFSNLKNPVLAFFPTVIQELNKEILNHPDLQAKLSLQPADEFEIRVAAIAAFLNIPMDGYFSREDLLACCAVLLQRLRDKRKAIIGVSSNQLPASGGKIIHD